MRESIEMPRGIFYIIVGICAAIIMFTSIDILFRTKDTALYEMWLSGTNFPTEFLNQTPQELYSTYIHMNISIFFVRVAAPMSMAIHTYFTLVKFRVNKLYVVLWSLILVASFAMTTLGEPFYSIFFILSAIGYLALIVTLINLGKCLYNVRSI